MKTQLFRLVLICMFFAGSAKIAYSQTPFCVIDGFGEIYNLSVDANDMITGTAYITGNPLVGWPVEGSFTRGSNIMLFTATNPTPDGCTYLVDAVTFRWKYTCNPQTTCAMDGGYQQICFGGVLGTFSLGATVYKNPGPCTGSPNSGFKGIASVGFSGSSRLSSLTSETQISVSPNVISNQATINLNLNAAGNVQVSVYNVEGQVVNQLMNQNMEAGNYTINWNADNSKGVAVSSGLYFIVLRVNGDVQTALVSKN